MEHSSSLNFSCEVATAWSPFVCMESPVITRRCQGAMKVTHVMVTATSQVSSITENGFWINYSGTQSKSEVQLISII